MLLSPYLYGNEAALTVSSGASYDPATIAWAAAVQTAGVAGSGAGTYVSTTQKGRVDTLIKAYKSASIFTLMDREWLLWSENIYQSQIDIINLATLTYNGTAGFNNNAGYTGDGISSYIDSGDAPSVVNANYQQASAMIDCWIHSGRTSGNAEAVFGTSYGPTNATLQPMFISGSAAFMINGDGVAESAMTPTTTQGAWAVVRTSSTVTACYQNAGALTSSGETYGTYNPGNNIYFGSGNGGGYADNFSTDTLAMAGIGAGLNSTQIAAKYAADSAYATASGF